MKEKEPRSIWSGAISFGLVNIPVKLLSAVQTETIDFDMLSKDDLAPIRYARIDTKTDKEIPFKKIVKGYQYTKGKYVVVTDADFEKARPDIEKTIDLLQFVKEEEIDAIYFEKPYYLVPAKAAEKSYKLLLKALEETRTVGIAEFVLRNRAHICVLKNHEGILLLNQLRYHEEVKALPEIATDNQRITPKEIQLATKLINQLTETFKPEMFKDTYVTELKKLIKAKAAGKITKEAAPKKTSATVKDLMDVLKESLDIKKKKRA